MEEENNMYYLWVLHYSLIKGVYKKRHKNISTSADGLAFMCLLILSLFLSILFIDKALVWELIRKKLPLGPMVRTGLIVFAPIMFFLLSRRLNKHRIRTIRNVLSKTKGLKRIYSTLYITVYVSLFVLTLVIIAKARTPL